MWSLYVPIHVKSLPKVKIYQAEVSSNIAQHHWFIPYKVMCGHGHYMCQFCQKYTKREILSS